MSKFAHLSRTVAMQMHPLHDARAVFGIRFSRLLPDDMIMGAVRGVVSAGPTYSYSPGNNTLAATDSTDDNQKTFNSSRVLSSGKNFFLRAVVLWSVGC